MEFRDSHQKNHQDKRSTAVHKQEDECIRVLRSCFQQPSNQDKFQEEVNFITSQIDGGQMKPSDINKK